MQVVKVFLSNAPKDLCLPSGSDLGRLTPREREVLDQLAEGFRYKEIVDNLSMSIGTLNGHVRNLYVKLRVHSRTEAVVKYLLSRDERRLG